MDKLKMPASELLISLELFPKQSVYYKIMAMIGVSDLYHLRKKFYKKCKKNPTFAFFAFLASFCSHTEIFEFTDGQSPLLHFSVISVVWEVTFM